MHESEANGLRSLLSPARLGEYEIACANDLTAALRLHCWNTEVSEAMYGPLQYLEIALRNVLHGELTRLFDQEEWWSASACHLHHVARSKIIEASATLRRVGAPATADQVVSELSFGFWVSLLGPGHNYDVRLWRPALHRAFPKFRGRRRELHKDLDYLRVLRNRIAHHRPIYRRHLAADHSTILKIQCYISPELAHWVERHSRVPEVLARRPGRRRPSAG